MRIFGRLIRRLITIYLLTGLVLVLPLFVTIAYRLALGLDTGIITNISSAIMGALLLLAFWPQMILDNFQFGGVRWFPDYVMIGVFLLGLIYVIIKTVREIRQSERAIE